MISGDTRPAPALLEACKDCDILLHEVYSAAGFKKRPPDWQRYHFHMHASTEELAEIASEIKPGLLVMTHLLLCGRSESELVAEVGQGYDGEVICADDLDVFELDDVGVSYGNLLRADYFDDE